MRVLFFVQFFYPSREIGAKRPSEMAKHFIAQGHEIDVLCAKTDDPWNEAQQNVFAGSRITEVSLPPDLVLLAWNALKRIQASLGKSRGTELRASTMRKGPTPKPQTVSMLRRWFFSVESLYCGLKLWTLRCVPHAIRELRHHEYDVVINSCPPMNTALAVWFARRFVRRFHWVIDLRDPFITPTAPFSSSWLRARLERWAERVCLNSCDTITVASPGLANDIVKRLPNVASKIHVVYNGYDTVNGSQQNMAGADLPSGGTLNLLSAGTIYFARDPRPLLDAIRLCISRHGLPSDAFRLTLLGNCENPSRETLQQWIEQRGLSGTVELIDAVPPHEVAKYVSRSHILINFAQGQHMLIPAKTYEYMASGRETITITEHDSETAHVVRKAACGPIAMPDPEALAAILQDLYVRYIEKRARFCPNLYAIREFSRTEQSTRFLHLVCERAAVRG